MAKNDELAVALVAALALIGANKQAPPNKIPANKPYAPNPTITERVAAKSIESGINPDTLGTVNQFLGTPNEVARDLQLYGGSWTVSGGFRDTDGAAVQRFRTWDEFRTRLYQWFNENNVDSSAFSSLSTATNIGRLFRDPPKPSDISDVRKRIAKWKGNVPAGVVERLYSTLPSWARFEIEGHGVKL